MKKFFLSLLIFLFLSLFVNSFTEMVVPAVNGDKGVSTYISASLYQVQSNEAGTYVDVEPFFSVDTQQSTKIATKVAANYLNQSLNNTALLFKIRATSIESVEGPSGGLALTLLAYAELSGKHFRSDYNISATGTINIDGTVGLVGGVDHKIAATKDVKINLMLIPLGQSDADGIDYSSDNNSKVKVIEVKNFSEAASIVFADSQTSLPIFNRSSYYDLRDASNAYPKTKFFKKIAENQLSISSNNFNTLMKVNDSTIQKSKRIIQRNIQEAQNALEKGYYYSAGNSAFLLSIRFDVLSAISKNATKDSILNLVDEQLRSAKSLNFTTPSKVEVGLYGGSIVRYYWALDKLNNVKKTIETRSVEDLLTDVYSAKYWLIASQQLNSQIQGSNDLLEESSLQKIASDYIKQVESNSNYTDQEYQSHLNTARQLFYDGKYVGSMYDSVFALAIRKSNFDGANYSTKEIETKIDNTPRVSLWGQLYYSQADYYLQTKNSGNEADIIRTAYRLSILSKNIDKIDLGIAGSKLENFNYNTQGTSNDLFIIILFSSFVIVGAIFFITFRNAITSQPIQVIKVKEKSKTLKNTKRSYSITSKIRKKKAA